MMDANRVYPIRKFIRHKAKMQILRPLEVGEDCPILDETLFQELVDTLFQSEQGRSIYTPCASREQAEQVEDYFAGELATAYLGIKQRQNDPLVRLLNTLLEG
jgi:hypothetical protein